MENKFLIMMIILFMGKNKDIEFSSLNTFGKFINTIELNPKYTVEKINVVKKIGPYFPEDYIPLINKSILFTEKLIKINELVNFMQNDEYRYVEKPIPVANNKERISKIIGTIQKEVPKSDVNNVGTVIDLIINMDKYKTMFTMLNSVMSNQEGLKDPNSLMNLIGPLMSNDNKMDNDKIKEMAKMMEIFKALNTPKKENNKIEIIEKPAKE
ncbi:hypothetical protein [Tissierella sp.]|uniref:hypothetical protein n=1 Tax=Tissierella sp. TaxID=41274 RepID=UPI002865EC08|nr:hypothetical protein [Tissierella sp.]MDR7857293.1 hypothetical protein [Tissierella sp.]